MGLDTGFHCYVEDSGHFDILVPLQSSLSTSLQLLDTLLPVPFCWLCALSQHLQFRYPFLKCPILLRVAIKTCVNKHIHLSISLSTSHGSVYLSCHFLNCVQLSTCQWHAAVLDPQPLPTLFPYKQG